MPSSSVTELALRSAVNTTPRDLKTSGQADAIKNAALKRANEQVTASSDVSSVAAQIGAQSAAIEGAIIVVTMAYAAISHQLDVLDNFRLSFDKERQAGIATFMIPINKEESDLSAEEKVLKGFLELGLGNPTFSTYLGIHSADLLNDKGAKFYSILPFYRMSEALGQPVASTKPLDRQRTAINLFLKSALPEAIADIDVSFQKDWKFVAFWESIFQKKNYLNNRRAPRFIIMSLSNLLWNLQHPVDPETGFPLSLDRCIDICHSVELFLNQLLNNESPPYLQNISNDENGLISFMRKLEIYTKTLRAAYIEEQLHELNIDEITNSAHEALRVMDKCLFKLIFTKKNHITQKTEPDENAAETLADMVSYLNLLLVQNDNLITKLGPYPAWIPQTIGMNKPPQTVVDVLIIFCHLSWRERDRLLGRLEKSNMSSELEFARALRKFDNKFVKPIKAVSKAELHASSFFPKHEEVGCLTASRLVPFITLVIEDYGISVDTPKTYEVAKHSAEDPAATRIWSGKEQVKDINLSAQTGIGYYKWALSPFTEGTKALDELPKYQYRLTQITKLMDSVSELVKNYRSFLLHKSFQEFLLKCLGKVKAEYAVLDKHIDEADACLARNERVSRSLQAILRPMMGKLNNSLDAFAVATTNFERVVSAPDFTDQQRQLLSTKVGAIAEQFSALFAEDIGVAALLDEKPIIQVLDPVLVSTNRSLAMSDAVVDTNKVLALRKLVENCYKALSYQSREGRKGLLLRELLRKMDSKPDFTEVQIKHVIMELIRVTASYRETWFFQAAYGQTRSAQPLIAAIKDQKMNKVLPLASIFFAQSDINMAQIGEEQIMQRLRSLRAVNHWQEASSNMRVSPEFLAPSP